MKKKKERLHMVSILSGSELSKLYKLMLIYKLPIFLLNLTIFR